MSISINSVNVISSKIAQALSISHLLMSDGEDIEEGFSCEHKIVVDSIWAISELLEEARQEFFKKGDSK